MNAAHQKDLREFHRDLDNGKIGTSWEPFCLAFAAAAPADLQRALDEIRPYGAGDAAGRIQFRSRAETFARRVGAQQPALVLDLLEAVCDGMDVAQAQMADILRAIPRS